MSIRIYVEGGGDRAEQKNRLRRGFQEFFKKAGLAGNMPKVVACGSRTKALERFSSAVTSNEFTALLLVDSEEPVKKRKPWQHLKDSDNWERPGGATDYQCHLMVQVMESWFLADVEALKSYYGREFQESAVSKNTDVEVIPKQEVTKRLEKATRLTKSGPYHKGNHSADLLSMIDPAEVRDKSSYARRLVSLLETDTLSENNLSLAAASRSHLYSLSDCKSLMRFLQWQLAMHIILLLARRSRRRL